MSIVKLVNGKKIIFANKTITNHNQLQGTTDYGCHPISAIRKLPEKLSKLEYDSKLGIASANKVKEELEKSNLIISANSTKINEIESKSKGITLIEDDQEEGKLVFTDYEGNQLSVQGGFLPDNDSIELNTSKKIALKKIYTNDEILSGLGTKESPLIVNLEKDALIKSINETQLNHANEIRNLNARVKGVGGYLNANNFNTSTPTQEALTKYALQQITTIQTKEEIFDQTKVKNEHDGHIWVFTNDGQTEAEWTDNGQEYINIAGNDGVQGIVTGSYEPFEGFVDILGHITINGLETFVENTNKRIPQVVRLK